MTNQVALIVGANRGLGLGLTGELLKRGNEVIATTRSLDRAGELQALERDHPGKLTIETLDMSEPAQIDSFEQRLNGRMLDILFVNAGISGPPHKSASQATTEEIGGLMFTNAIAPIRLARHLLGHVREDTGVIAFMSSVMGSIADNTNGSSELYRASKAALNSLTRSMVAGLDRPLTVLTLHPGWVQTDMGGAGADLDVTTSARGVVGAVLARHGQPGSFFVDESGTELAW